MEQHIVKKGMLARKLDYVTDGTGTISMVIFNSHPPDCLFVAPKYFPHPQGTWMSQDGNTRYHRFEYFWNIKNEKITDDMNAKNERVYDVDKNPHHEYDMHVREKFGKHLVHDDCHGVSMYCLPVDDVVHHYPARQFYEQAIASAPACLAKFDAVLGTVRGHLHDDELGITGSYLYGIYQDFS
nr:hypothetical protein [Candidatus Sigynarchaeota archaeon]